MDIATLEKTFAENARQNILESSLLGSEELLAVEGNCGNLSDGKLQEDMYSMGIPVAVKLENPIQNQDQQNDIVDGDLHTGPGFIQPHPFNETETVNIEENVEINCNSSNANNVDATNSVGMCDSNTAEFGEATEEMHVELDPSNNIDSSVENDFCANCRSPKDSFSKKFNELLPMQYFNPSTGDYAEIEIVEALCEIFKIRWTCENFSQLCNTDNLELCNQCSTLLVQLYRFYTQFAVLTLKSKSFLSTVVSFHKDLNNIDESNTRIGEHESDSEHFMDAEDTFPEADDELRHDNHIYEKKHNIVTRGEYIDDDPTEPKESNIPLKKRINTKPMKKARRQNSKRLSQILKRLAPSSAFKKTVSKPHIAGGNLTCKQCCKDFKFPIQLRIHLNSPAHKDKLKQLRNEGQSASETEFSSVKGIKVEKKDKDGKVPAKRGRKKKAISLNSDAAMKKRSNERKKNKTCPVCEKPFARTKDLKRHLNTHEKKKKKGNPTIECERCGKKFDTEGGLKIHFAAHVRDDNKHICKDCGKKFRKLEALEHHEKVDHGGFKPHECPHCGKCFRLKDKLKLHVMSIHEKRNPFPCQKCEKAFRTKYHLKIHDVAVHVQGGDSVLGCSQCKRKFTDREALEKHVVIHQQEKPYICEKCNKGFQTSARLKLHEKSHLEVPTCLCPICGRAYKHIRDLKLHEVSHQDESTFRFGCGDCGKKFYRIDLLRVHQSNEKHFSPDVVGPSPALRDKALGMRESTFYDLPNTYTNYGEHDDEDEFESGDDAVMPTPKPKRRRVTKPKQRKIALSSSTDSLIANSIPGHGNVPVIYYQSSVASHFDDHQGPSRDTTSFIPRTEPSAAFSFNSRDTTRPTLLHSHAHANQQSSHSHPHPNTNPAHNQLQIPLVSAHAHNQFSNYVIREIGNDRSGNLVQGAEQIGFDVISSFINNLG